MHPAAIMTRMFEVEKMKEAKIQEGTWKEDAYARGFADGLISAAAVIKGEEPVLLKSPKQKPVEEANWDKLSSDAVQQLVGNSSDVTFLTASLQHERRNKNRKGVIESINARLEKLTKS